MNIIKAAKVQNIIGTTKKTNENLKYHSKKSLDFTILNYEYCISSQKSSGSEMFSTADTPAKKLVHTSEPGQVFCFI